MNYLLIQLKVEQKLVYRLDKEVLLNLKTQAWGHKTSKLCGRHEKSYYKKIAKSLKVCSSTTTSMRKS